MSVKYNFSNLNLAVVGCGNWGKNLIRVFHQCGVLRGICDKDPIKAQDFSEAFNVKAMSLEEILQSSNIDAVALATPSKTHEAIARLLLEEKKHVFIEKPFTLETQSALALHQLAQEQNRILMVGHLLQYHSGFKKVKELSNGGALGKLQYIQSQRTNFGKFPGEENVIWDFAPHDVSMVLALMGELPHQVLASGQHYFHHTQLDHANIHLDFHGRHAHILVSWIYPNKEQKLTVVGDKAIAIFDDTQPWESKLRLHHYPNEWNDGLPRPFPAQIDYVALEVCEPLLNECQHFLQCVVENHLPISDGLEASRVITVLESSLQSIKTQKPISIASSQSTWQPSKKINTLPDEALVC